MEAIKLQQILEKLEKERQEITTLRHEDLTDETVYRQHLEILIACGMNSIAKENKKFSIDSNNEKIIRYLIYYFNGCVAAAEVFPDKNYQNHKNLLICGEVGVGKTILFDAFSLYLKHTHNPNFFHNLSVTQMVNYYKVNNHLDRYTYNEEGSKGFKTEPVNICLNDVGLQSHLHFGMDTKILVTDFFHARNEVWVQYGKFAHITTNLTPKEIKEYLRDDYGRLEDRLKTYNIIHLGGNSRR